MSYENFVLFVCTWKGVITHFHFAYTTMAREASQTNHKNQLQALAIIFKLVEKDMHSVVKIVQLQFGISFTWLIPTYMLCHTNGKNWNCIHIVMKS
jgi:hypothetical protein